MDFSSILSSFAHDKQVAVVLSLIVADFLLGVGVAFKTDSFRLTYIANFARNDLLGKVFPWFVVFALDKASQSADIVGPIDWSQANDVAFGVITLAMAGSILSSLSDFGIKLPAQIAGRRSSPASPA
jgi:hypothetical protein